MGIPQEQTDRIEVLRGLIQRLSAPELTLAEAKVLRDRVAGLLNSGDRRGRRDPMIPVPSTISPSDWGDGTGPEIWSPDPSLRVAG